MEIIATDLLSVGPDLRLLVWSLDNILKEVATTFAENPDEYIVVIQGRLRFEFILFDEKDTVADINEITAPMIRFCKLKITFVKETE